MSETAWAELAREWFCPMDETERVAMIDGSGKLVEFQNVHATPSVAFKISVRDWRRFNKNGVALVHTHPDKSVEADGYKLPGNGYPSVIDQRQQIASGRPWGVASNSGVFFWGDLDREPLGRGYRFAVNDCYSLVRDLVRCNTGRWLPNFPRRWEFWRAGERTFNEHLTGSGWRQLSSHESPQMGDGVLLSIPGPGHRKAAVPNHCGLIYSPGVLAHHPAGRHPVDDSVLSRLSPLDRLLQYEHTFLRLRDA